MIGGVILAALCGAPSIALLEPDLVEAGEGAKLVVVGAGFRREDRVFVAGEPIPTRYVGPTVLTATLTARAPGSYLVAVGTLGALCPPRRLVVRAPPRLAFVPIAPRTLDEGERVTLQVELREGEGARVFATELPPGAEWSERERVLSFQPDLIQGGHEYGYALLARRGAETATIAGRLVVRDTQRAADPVVRKKQSKKGFTRLILDQPGEDGRVYEARLCVATATTPLPLQLFLHGAQAKLSDSCVAYEHRLYPSDPDTTYWWGEGAPHPENLTQRRVLFLLEWVMRSFPGVDPSRVYVAGSSMGGAGSLTLGLLYERHFAMVESYWAQSIPRAHRPGRMSTLRIIWGAPPPFDPDGKNPWDLLDVTRILMRDAEARRQYLFVRHGKDDPVIHFGAAVRASPLTGRALYPALEETKVGHYVVWDEAGHGVQDPVMGKRWWDEGWSPMHDHQSQLRVGAPFPAFSRSSANESPGDGEPKTPRPLDPTRGYAGKVSKPGDTGWTGALAGAFNRYLRWDARAMVDTVDRFELPLFARYSPGARPPRAGYPPKKDGRESDAPIVVSVTPRRARQFLLLEGERVRFSYGDRSGEVVADADGVVTVEGLEVTRTPRTLVLERLSAARAE